MKNREKAHEQHQKAEKTMKTMKMLGVTWLFVLFGWCGGTGLAFGGPIIYNTVGPLGSDYPNLREVNADGTNDHPVPISGVMWGADRPALSRDGKRIAATGIIGGNMSSAALAVFDPAVTRVLVPSRPAAGYYGMYKAFSPDGSKLAYSNLALNFAEFGILDLNSGAPMTYLVAGVPVAFLWSPNVTFLGDADNTSGLSGYGIDWSPIAGSNLLVVSYADPYYPATCPSTFNAADALANSLLGMPLGWNTNPTAPANPTRLYSVPVVSNGLSKAQPLTNPSVTLTCMGQIGGDLFPAFSNDGSQIAFVRWQAKTSHVLLIPASGCWPVETGCVKEIAQAPGLIDRLSWSPDDSQLLVSYGTSLWKVNANGSGSTPFSGPALGAYDAAWSR